MDGVKRFDTEKFGSVSLGFLHPVEKVGFDIKRVYWIEGSPDLVKRGRHAHRTCDQVFYCLKGQVFFKTEEKGKKPDIIPIIIGQGLTVPRMVWHEMTFRGNAVLMAIASEEYNEADYIREYDKWKEM